MTNRGTLAKLYPAHLDAVKQRFDRALAESGFDHAVIYGGAQHMIFLDDMPYPFKVNPHFKWWVPVLTNPHCFIVYSTGKKPVLVYFQPVDYWHKPAETPAGFWVEQFDIRMIASPDDARQHLPGDLKRAGFVGEFDPRFEAWGLGNANPRALLDRIDFDRAWKTPYEIECMRQANEAGVRGHLAAERAFRNGASEYEIHLEYMKAARHTEAQLPYGNIIGLNEHAAVLHYQYLERERPDAVSFLIDAGAEMNGYASDITRTYSKKEDEFQELIDSVDQLQLELCSEVRPGIDYKTLHLMAHHKVGDVLRAHGFTDAGAGEAVETKITSAFFPHGVGHYIGLQVHDVGGFSADPKGKTIEKPEGHPHLRLTRVVEENHVFTIEPGIYFIESLLADLRQREAGKRVNWEKVDSFVKYGGVRIEDDLVVTGDGHENLTREQFRTLDV